MYRLIVIVSLLPIIIAMVTRWWFGLRVLASEGKRRCHCDLTRWVPTTDGKSSVRRSDETAAGFGRELRNQALQSWRENEPQAAIARENSRRFAAVVPPLAVMVAAMALLVGKLSVMGVFAVLFASTALAAAMTLLTLPAELRAIARHAQRVRSEKSFPDRDDEQAVIDSATAHAWDASTPHILRLLQG
jgi:ABC-type transport system involved in cytochrome bd biosynthesis fused ATPase/permease subunit